MPFRPLPTDFFGRVSLAPRAVNIRGPFSQERFSIYSPMRPPRSKPLEAPRNRPARGPDNAASHSQKDCGEVGRAGILGRSQGKSRKTQVPGCQRKYASCLGPSPCSAERTQELAVTKLVRFTKPMRPFGIGDQRLVPDDVAARLAAEGVIEPNPPDFPRIHRVRWAPQSRRASRTAGSSLRSAKPI